ncbi:MAG: type III-A CRISPR-associated RAMP protein Csm5 [Syntrophorhabdaceae bacterium]|nr:type III-A CRISPR-associated RAMP protein Csm5 [Syntrophorhabdaceae bacterium]
MEKPIKIRLHVLSPIHIGCDDVYEPVSFILDERRKKLLEFDPLEFIKNLEPKKRDEFSRLCMGDDLLNIFKFVKNNFNENINHKEVDIATGLLEHYKKVLSMSTYDKNRVINQFTINKTAYNPQTDQVFIPGSSLKGALRTAFLSILAVNKGIKGWKGKGVDLEINLLGGKFDTDPFRLVKVSDFFPVNNVRTKIYYGVNKKKTVSTLNTVASTGPQQIFEAIEKDSIFEGIINFSDPVDNSMIKIKIDQKLLFLSANKSYKKIFDDEEKAIIACGFKKINGGEFLNRLNENCSLVRLGRHSGAEAVTIEGNRSIKIMQGRGKSSKYLDHSTTIWLASETPRPTTNNGLIPFGWAVLEVLPFDQKDGLFNRQITTTPKKNIEFSEKKEEKLTEVKEVKADREKVEKEYKERTISNALIIYNPGNKSLTTTVEGKKAFIEHIDDKFVPEHLWPKLKKDRAIKATIVVEPFGNAFRIVSIKEE